MLAYVWEKEKQFSRLTALQGLCTCLLLTFASFSVLLCIKEHKVENGVHYAHTYTHERTSLFCLTWNSTRNNMAGRVHEICVRVYIESVKKVFKDFAQTTAADRGGYETCLEGGVKRNWNFHCTHRVSYGCPFSGSAISLSHWFCNKSRSEQKGRESSIMVNLCECKGVSSLISWRKPGENYDAWEEREAH